MPRGTPRVSPPLCGPISVLAQNLGGIPSVLIQVLFSLPICLLQGGVAKSYEGMQNTCLLCGQDTDLTTVTATNPAKIAGKGWTGTRPLQVLHTLQWHHPGGRALGNWL